MTEDANPDGTPSTNDLLGSISYSFWSDANAASAFAPSKTVAPGTVATGASETLAPATVATDSSGTVATGASGTLSPATVAPNTIAAQATIAPTALAPKTVAIRTNAATTVAPAVEPAKPAQSIAPALDQSLLQHPNVASVYSTANLLWQCDATGAVQSFTDPHGMRWQCEKQIYGTGMALFKSRDGGERLCTAGVSDGSCTIEDADGTVTIISSDGTFLQHRKADSKENKMRALLDVFIKTDSNGDQRLSLSELDHALEDDRTSESDKEILRSLRTQFKRIEWSKHGMFNQANAYEGLSLKDILSVTGSNERLGADINETLLIYIEEVLDIADPNKSGFVSCQSLAQVLPQLKMPERLRFSFETLLKRIFELRQFDRLGFQSNRWLIRRNSIRLALCEMFKEFPESGNGQDWVSLEINLSVNALFANANDPLSCIRPDAVRNCPGADQTFMAALASIAARAPQVIMRSIKVTDNGAFVVTFPANLNLPIRVLTPSHKEVCQYGLAERFGIWALVLAKAFDEYKSRMGINGADQIAQLFGNVNAGFIPLSEIDARKLSDIFRKASAECRMLVLCSYPSNTSPVADEDVILQHAYAITKVTSDSIDIMPVNRRKDKPAQIDDLSSSVRYGDIADQFQLLIYG